MNPILEVICGGMFSGKTEELIRRVRRAHIAGRRTQTFKPVVDQRYHAVDVASHVGSRWEAEVVADVADLAAKIREGTEVIAIEEAQFLGPDVVPLVERLISSGRQVLVCGLDLDYRGEPFEPMPELMSRADTLTKLSAICVQCGNHASRSQRLYEGEPAPASLPRVAVGGAESYEARCRRCFVVPV